MAAIRLYSAFPDLYGQSVHLDFCLGVNLILVIKFWYFRLFYLPSLNKIRPVEHHNFWQRQFSLRKIPREVI